MIRYFDSSALVKRYVREEGSTRVRRLLGQGVAATARYSIVEMVSALARRARQGDLTPAEVERIARAIRTDAEHLTLVELTESVASRASDLLLAHPLRAADAVQLASCLLLRERASPDLRFTTYDSRLAAAAEAEGVQVD